jgi:LCP family protein required for cell wall assembly
MSKKSIEDILSDIENDGSGESVKKTENNGKTPVKFKKKKKKSWKKRIILTLLVIFLVGGSVVGAKAYMLAKKMFEGGAAPGLLGFLGQGQLKGEADGRINILLLGMGGGNHPGGTLTDTIMVASIKPATNEVAMLSVPRDLYVTVDGYGKDKINAAHALGEQKNYSGGGMALAKETVSKTLDLPIHYTVRVDFEGFSKLVDAVGGVDIDVEEDLYDPFYPDGYYTVKKGMHHMDGKAALKYARSRETTSDFDRAKRQQKIIVAVKEKVLSASTLTNPQKMNDILDVLGDHIKTDMQIWEAQKLATMFQKVDKNKIINRVLDNSEDGPLESGNMGMYVLLPKTGNFKEIQAIAKNIFTDSALRGEAAKLQILNATGVSGQAKKTADGMSGLGLKMEDMSNAKEVSTTTVIYDHSNGTKSKTIEFLEKKFCVKATQKTDETGLYDITVSVGKDQLNKD